MSWYNYTRRKCLSCELEFNQSNDTLSIANKLYNKCPKCLKDTICIDSTDIRLEEYFKSKV